MGLDDPEATGTFGTNLYPPAPPPPDHEEVVFPPPPPIIKTSTVISTPSLSNGSEPVNTWKNSVEVSGTVPPLVLT